MTKIVFKELASNQNVFPVSLSARVLLIILFDLSMELTGRSNGMGYEQRKTALRLFITGWLEYFRLADMQSKLQSMDEWYRRRLRMCIWKYWKKIKARFRNLQKCGIDKNKA